MIRAAKHLQESRFYSRTQAALLGRGQDQGLCRNLRDKTSAASNQEQGSAQADETQNIFKTNNRHHFNPAALLRKSILGHARKSDKAKSNGSQLSVLMS
jgi:hypothetical protein